MDIDQLSEPELVRLYQSALSDRTGEVNGALNMGNHKGALAAALKKPPLGVSNQALLDESTQLVVQVISSAKAADAPGMIGELSDPQADLLLKYIYRGMSSYSLQSGDQANGVLSALLAWHEAIVSRTGLGAIIRAMAERKNIL